MKYIKVSLKEMEKYQEESWYEEFCYEWSESSIHDSNRVVFVPEDIYNKCVSPGFRINDKVIYNTSYGDKYQGIITKIDESKPYSVSVMFNNGELEHFTIDGRYELAGGICLFKQ